jgi:hypothetical protein
LESNLLCVHTLIHRFLLVSPHPSSHPFPISFKIYVQVYRCILESTRYPSLGKYATTHSNTKKVTLETLYATARQKRKEQKSLQYSNKSLESPRRGAIGGSRHARKSSTSSGASSPENAGAGRMVERRRRRSSRVALRSRARILQHSLDLDDLDLRDALDRLDDDGGLHDHDDGLRGH